MIKFNCTNCGRKISARETFAGKKGKCPKCKTIIVVPQAEESDLVAGRENENIDNEDLITWNDTEMRLKKEPPTPTKSSGKIQSKDFDTTEEYARLMKKDLPEEPPIRKLPWFVDIFLYPTSMPGLINIGIFCGLMFLLGILSLFAINLVLATLLFLISITVVAYMCYYFIECIRDSASGGIRAPENIGSMPDRSEALSQLWSIFISIIIFWGPLLGYNIYRHIMQVDDPNLEYIRATDPIFWLLLGYGVFFFPMGILALAMFNSSSAYNPLVWITSIFSTFFQYCGLVLFFSILALLASRISAALQGGLLNALFLNAIFIYLTMVAAHLMGRFYYKNSKELNWDV
jgi:phage FluMu protein Com